MLPWNPPASLGGSSNNGVAQQQQHSQQQSQIQPQRPPLNNANGGGGGGQWGGPPAPQQPQLQQQQQQGMQILQSQQQQLQQDNSNGQQSQQPAPITLSSVLHYLQTEWRRYERERNEWEIERGEMRVSCLLLLMRCAITLNRRYWHTCQILGCLSGWDLHKWRSSPRHKLGCHSRSQYLMDLHMLTPCCLPLTRPG